MINWIARDKHGGLFMYASKPVLDVEDGGYYYAFDATGDRPVSALGKTLFPEVTFEGGPVQYLISMVGKEEDGTEKA